MNLQHFDRIEMVIQLFPFLATVISSLDAICFASSQLLKQFQALIRFRQLMCCIWLLGDPGSSSYFG